jgi:hypothetical protein
MSWPEAFAYVGVAFAAAWAIRSFLRVMNGDRP